ncbi:unnamed protein product, partial [Tilletia laevis]
MATGSIVPLRTVDWSSLSAIAAACTEADRPARRFAPMRSHSVAQTQTLQVQTHARSGRRMINQYIILHELGRGVHGQVRLALDSNTLSDNEDDGDDDDQHGRLVAVKIVQRQPRKRLKIGGGGLGPSANSAAAASARSRGALLLTTDAKVKREIDILKKLHHHNVVSLLEVIDDPDSKKIFIVLEYMAGGELHWRDESPAVPGTLEHRLSMPAPRPTLTIPQIQGVMRDLVCGLQYLHSEGVIHRDIKPANLLWDEYKRTVKISDFGVSHYSATLKQQAHAHVSAANSSHTSATSSPLVVSHATLPSDTFGPISSMPSDEQELAKTAGSPAFFAPELCVAGDPSFATSRSILNLRHLSPSSSSAGSTTLTGEPPPAPPAANNPHVIPPGKCPPITKAIDIWAVGVTLYCLCFGHPPFDAESEFALFNIIPNEDYEVPAWAGAPDRNLDQAAVFGRWRVGPRARRWGRRRVEEVASGWGSPWAARRWADEEADVHPDSRRPSFSAVRSSSSTSTEESSFARPKAPHWTASPSNDGSWLPDLPSHLLSSEAVQLLDLLDSLLTKDPAKRITLEDVKTHPFLHLDPTPLSSPDPDAQSSGQDELSDHDEDDSAPRVPDRGRFTSMRSLRRALESDDDRVLRNDGSGWRYDRGSSFGRPAGATHSLLADERGAAAAASASALSDFAATHGLESGLHSSASSSQQSQSQSRSQSQSPQSTSGGFYANGHSFSTHARRRSSIGSAGSSSGGSLSGTEVAVWHRWQRREEEGSGAEEEEGGGEGCGVDDVDDVVDDVEGDDHEDDEEDDEEDRG